MQDWLKLHTDLLDNPDVALISPLDFQIFIFLLMLCRQEGFTDGRLVGWDYPRLAYRFRKTAEEVENSVTRLKRPDVTWCNVTGNGEISVCNYMKRQFTKPSASPDAVRERVKRHRNRLKEAKAQDSSFTINSGNALVTRSNAIEEKRVEEKRVITTSGADAPEVLTMKPPVPGNDKPESHNRRSQAIGELEAAFVRMTKIAPPNRETDKQKRESADRWWNPLGVLLDLSGGDIRKATTLMQAATNKLRAGSLTFDAPASLIKTARSIQANGQQPPTRTLRGPNE